MGKSVGDEFDDLVDDIGGFCNGKDVLLVAATCMSVAMSAAKMMDGETRESFASLVRSELEKLDEVTKEELQ